MSKAKAIKSKDKTPRNEEQDVQNEVKLLGIKITDSTVLRVVDREYKGTRAIDLRFWYKRGGGPFLPGKGVSISPKLFNRMLKLKPVKE